MKNRLMYSAIMSLLFAIGITTGANAQLNRTDQASKKSVSVTKYDKAVELDFDELSLKAQSLSDQEKEELLQLKNDLEGKYEIKTRNPRLKPALPITIYSEIAKYADRTQITRLNIGTDIFVIVK